MSIRPRRETKPVPRYEPEEIPVDDDYDDELLDESEAKKRLRGEFDGYDDEEEEEESDEPNEYDVDDGFAVPDDYDDDEVELHDHDEDEEEEYLDDDEEDDDNEGSDAPSYEEEYENDVAVPEGRLEEQAKSYSCRYCGIWLEVFHNDVNFL